MSVGIVSSIHLPSNGSGIPPVYSQGVNKFKVLTYANIEKFWSYGGKILLITRNFLNAAAKFASDFANRIVKVVPAMKIFSIVSVPFSIVDLKSYAQKIARGAHINDKEGVALSLLSFTITAADAFDSITTFVNAVLTLAASYTVAVFSTLALPVAFVISGLGIISRTIQIAKAASLYRNLNPDVFPELKHKDKNLLKSLLEQKLGVDEEVRLIKMLSSAGPMDKATFEKVEKLKEKKKEIILRMIPKDAVESFEKLFALLDVESSSPLTDKELAEVFKCFKDIRSHLRKKMKVDVIGIVANLIIISALVLFTIGTGGALPFILLGVAFMIRIASLIYQEYKNKKPVTNA